MILSITTRWNAGRHSDGKAMIEEILELGVDHVELGYDLRLDLVPGVRDMVESKAVRVRSVHNFCPVPIGAPQGHPELFTIGSSVKRIREAAITHTLRTIEFAAEIGAEVVVTHVGNVDMKRLTLQLVELCEANRQFDPIYDKKKIKLQMLREKKGQKHVKWVYEGIERLLPALEKANVRLGIENLPTWEALLTEAESEALFDHFKSKFIGHWHDIGHGRIRENLGLISQVRWLERLQPHLVGMHVHDVAPPARDHLMPSLGNIDFQDFAKFAKLGIPLVIEPTPRTTREDILTGLAHLQAVWERE